jgi:hypothetical protein
MGNLSPAAFFQPPSKPYKDLSNSHFLAALSPAFAGVLGTGLYWDIRTAPIQGQRHKSVPQIQIVFGILCATF